MLGRRAPQSYPDTRDGRDREALLAQGSQLRGQPELAAPSTLRVIYSWGEVPSARAATLSKEFGCAVRVAPRSAAGRTCATKARCLAASAAQSWLRCCMGEPDSSRARLNRPRRH